MSHSAGPTPTLTSVAPEGTPAKSASVDSDARVPSVDGLRGVAILLVMLSHFVRAPQSGLLVDRIFWRVASVGWCGVDLFFVLSGFLITGNLLDGAKAGSSLRNFYARRVLRVVPAYYALLALILVVRPHLVPADAVAMRHLGDNQAWYWGFASNVLIARPGQWEAAVPWTLHFWSLAVEEQFYLVWPLLIWFGGRQHAAALCIAALLVSVVGRIVWWQSTHDLVGSYTLTPLRFDGLAAGAFVAVGLRSARLRSRLERSAVAAALAALGVFALLVASTPEPQNFQPKMQLLGFPVLAVAFAALLVLALRQGGRVARWLSARPLRLAGRYSYAAYLLHYPVIFAVASFGLLDDALPRLAGSQLHSMLLLVAVAGTVSFVLAWVSWHLVESHALRLKRVFPYGRASASAAAVVQTNSESGLAA